MAQKTDVSIHYKKSYLVAKRATDLLLAVIGLVICIIPMLLVALIIRLESKGSPIYLHQRIGQNGSPLPLLKFRTMYLDADKMIDSFTPEQKEEWERNFKLDNDPRITKVGKFLRKSSIDELPQLVNILIGNLSLVGPRPIVQNELDRYGENKALFLSPKPGLTGYWQAYARSNCSYEQRMEMELHYAKNANFLWDVKIAFATVGAVLRKQGAK